MPTQEDKTTGENNSGSAGGILPEPLTSLEKFLKNNPSGAPGILDGKIIPPSNPNSILPDPMRLRPYMDWPDQTDAETKRLASIPANSKSLDQTISKETDTQRESSSPSRAMAEAGGASPNLLNDYANYTYGITLYVASANEYTPGAVSGQVMIVSGGSRENRHPSFNEDFFFEHLKLDGVIGLNHKSRNSNVITVEFMVIEPFGMTLMDRILEVANSLGVKNWHEMLFTLQIDFFGNTDDGGIAHPIPGGTKYIQTKLIGCDVKVGSKGAEYKFTAIPFAHQAYTETIGVSPAFHESIGKTVDEIFADDGQGSYAKALNEHQKNQVKNKHQKYADVYKFVIDGEIGGTNIVESKSNDIKSSAMPSSENSQVSKDVALQSTKSGKPIPLALDKQRLNINAGTSIVDVINLVVRNSEYISKQINPGKGSNKVLNWFKIVPKIEYGEFDDKRNTYQKTITYYVTPYQVYNTKYPDAPMKTPEKDKWAKQYNYIFTGLNDQIIDFNVDFNTLFYTMMTARREQLEQTEVKPNDPDSKEEKEEADKGSGAPRGAGTIAPNRKSPVTGITQMAGLHQGTNDTKNIGANDLYSSLMSGSRGDMINVQLKITGDPEFIKQDDIFYGPNEGSGDSISMDTQEVYVGIDFRTPSDIIQDTGKMDFSSYPKSVFSGVYRVLRVESVFDRGQFYQSLDCIRLFDEGPDTSGDNIDAGGGWSPASERSDAGGLGNAKEQAEQEALEESQAMMNSGSNRKNSYVSEETGNTRSMDKEQPNRVTDVADPAEIARENTRALNKAAGLAKTTTAEPTDLELFFTNGIPPIKF